MRDILPETVPLADAVANLGRVALGVAGLAAGRPEALRTLTVDRLHGPYRADLSKLPSCSQRAGGRALGVPVRQRLDGHRLRRLAVGPLRIEAALSADRGGSGPAGSGRGARLRSSGAKVVAGA